MGASRSGDAFKVSPRLKEVLDTHSGRWHRQWGTSEFDQQIPHRILTGNGRECRAVQLQKAGILMSSISFIGLGGMARAIAARAVAGGNSVELVGRDATKATDLAAELGGGATVGTFGTVPAGDIVVLAVPYTSAVAVVTQYGDALAGKVIIDISNTFNADATGLITPDGMS